MAISLSDAAARGVATSVAGDGAGSGAATASASGTVSAAAPTEPTAPATGGGSWGFGIGGSSRRAVTPRETEQPELAPISAEASGRAIAQGRATAVVSFRAASAGRALASAHGVGQARYSDEFLVALLEAA